MADNNMEKMLRIVSMKLGTSPEQLKKALEQGRMNDIVAGMNEQDRQRLTALLSNKALLNRIMNSSQAAELMKNFNK